MQQSYMDLVYGTGLPFYFDAHSGALEVKVPVGVAIITDPEATTAIVGADHEVAGKWVMSLETSLGKFIVPQVAVETLAEAHDLLVEWSERYEEVVN